MHTRIIFILDASQSMRLNAGGVRRGLINLLDEQRDAEIDQLSVSAWSFSYTKRNLTFCKDISQINPTRLADQYICGGNTRLLDTVSDVITAEHKQMVKEGDDAPDNIILVIATDGQDNESTENTPATIQQMIKFYTEEKGWDIIYLGVNMDGFQARNMGISCDKRATPRVVSEEGMSNTLAATSSYIRRSRNTRDASIMTWSQAERDKMS